MKILKNKKILIPLISLILLGISIVGISYSQILFNGEQFISNTRLIYYLDVYYDGVDKNGIKSNDTTISNVTSGYMLVEDKIPDGMIFEGFVTTSDGSIGATKRDDDSSCIGSVYDDTKETNVDSGTWNNDNTEYYYHGLHYNVETRMVSFRVKNLKAGCKVTVGIITKTPSSIDNDVTETEERRKDFYNIATVREDAITVISNLLHGYIGTDVSTLYNVSYSFVGELPSNTPILPNEIKYIKGEKVNVLMPINIEGYTFSGWSTNDVEVENDYFTMPNKDVTFTGYYTPDTKYKVKYVINGNQPSGYVLPNEREYYQDNSVMIDSMKKNDVFNGYRFSGWTTSDITIDSNDDMFVMPNKDVTFTGGFTEAKYKITYKFSDTVLPSNANSLLPSVQEYKPGTIVSLPTLNDVNGYHFLGWNRDNNFIMPNNDIVVYGEWIEKNGYFEPLISIEIVDQKETYRGNDIVKFKITITNNNDFSLNDVVIKENNAEFITGDDYIVQSKHYAIIETLAPGTSKTLYSTYKVLKTDCDKVINEVEVVGGLTNNHKLLNVKKASISFDILSNLVIHHYLKDTTTSVYEDEVMDVPFGSTYETTPKSSSQLYDEYRNKYSKVGNSSNTKGIISSNNIEVIYYYGIETYNITIDVIGGVGSVTGSEIVIGGNDSKQDIVIKPNDGYIIDKILVNGIEVEITDEKGMTLDKFINVHENKKIEVNFVEENQLVPITGISIKIYMIVNILMFIAFVMYCLYKRFTSKKVGGEL